MVIGPTPPGTGEIAPATSFASSKTTSPVMRYPRSRVASSTRLVPTSITVAPGRTISPVTVPGRPMATIRISPSRVTAPRSGVRLCATVTVAFPPGALRMSRDAIGFPTMLERPTITACLPEGSTPERKSIWITPAGVHGASTSGAPVARRPTFTGWKPSTSFPGRIRSSTTWSRIWSGRGSCTRMP